MLTMAAARAETYYTTLAREDYYLKGGEPLGQWVGRGALALGLDGKVDTATFSHLYAGLSPDGTKALVRNPATSAATKHHHPGWDLTFSAPKSVSVFWSQADQETRRAIQAAHHEALSRAVGYLEDVAAATKRGRGGTAVETPVGLVAATFEHGTSRAQDPQLHTHCVVFNLAPRQDGTTGTVLGRPLFQHKMAAGALYRAELVHLLSQRLGLRFEARGRYFELAGVPQDLLDHFSKRRKEIVAAMEKRGVTGAKAAAKLNLATRHVKEHLARELLLGEWGRVGEAHGFSTREATALLHRERPATKDVDRCLAAVLEGTTEHFVRKATYFTETAFMRALADRAPAERLSTAALRAGVRQYLATSSTVVPLGNVQGQAYFVPTAALEHARDLFLEVELQKHRASKTLPDRSIGAAIRKTEKARGETFSAKVKHAVLYLARGGQALRGVTGLSLDEKLAAVQATKTAFERRGFQVLGISCYASGPNLLEHQTGMKTYSLPTFFEASRTKSAWEAYCTAQKAAARTPDGFSSTKAFLKYMEQARKAWLKPNRKTVIILDGSEKASDVELTALVHACRKSGATLLTVGEGGLVGRHQDLAELNFRELRAQAVHSPVPEQRPKQEPPRPDTVPSKKEAKPHTDAPEAQRSKQPVPRRGIPKPQQIEELRREQSQ